jgi:hypothetical protein
MLQRGNPISMAHPSGVGTMMISPSNPSIQQQFMPKPEMIEQSIGDLKTKVPMYWTPQGPQMRTPQFAPKAIGPQSSADPDTAPAVAPATAPQGRPSPGPTPTVASAQNAPVLPSSPANATAGTPSAPGGPPVQVASLDPNAAFALAAKGAGGPDAAKPPETEKPPLGKLAANDAALRQIFGDQMVDAMLQNQNIKQQNTLDEEAGKKAGEFAGKKYDTLSGNAQTGRKLMNNVDLALHMVNDPRFAAGIFSGPKNWCNGLKQVCLVKDEIFQNCSIANGR